MKRLNRCPVKNCKHRMGRHPLCSYHWSLVHEDVRKILDDPMHKANAPTIATFEAWKANVMNVAMQLEQWEAEQSKGLRVESNAAMPKDQLLLLGGAEPALLKLEPPQRIEIEIETGIRDRRASSQKDEE